MKKGIYQNENGLRLKVHSINNSHKSKGWNFTKIPNAVMSYTNLDNYGKSHFGIEGENLVNFIKDFKLVKEEKSDIEKALFFWSKALPILINN